MRSGQLRVSLAVTAALFAVIPLSGQTPPAGTSISLPAEFGSLNAWFYKEVDLPAGKIAHAWAAISATHECVLYINGQEASRSRYGRVASAFRLAEEVEDLAALLKPGARNVLVIKTHVWSLGSPESPMAPSVRLECEVQMEGVGSAAAVSVCTDATWLGSYAAPADMKSQPAGAQAVVVNPDPNAGRLGPRIPKDRKSIIMPDVPPPLPKPALAALPQIAEMSDWSQQAVWRDLAAETERLLKVFPSRAIAQRYAQAISTPNTGLGDSFSINVYSIGNGWAWTAMGGYPFYNIGVVCGPEYQYPIQWNAGSTFLGDNLSITSDGKGLDLRNQWMWKIRQTDVVVTAAADPKGEVVFYTLTFAPPDLKALVRIFAVANNSDKPLPSVKVSDVIGRTKVAGKTLTETVKHPEMKAGAENTRTMIAGVLDEAAVSATTNADKNGVLEISFGDVPAGECKKHLVYRVMYLETWDNKPVPSDADQTLAAIQGKKYALLDETIKYWHDYNAGTTHIEAPGPWGRRVADFIDDEKMLVQTQQFARTGAVGPMWFFSDEWIRDACGPIKSFLRIGRADNARRAIDYFHTASVANRIVLNWVGMDIDITKPWPPVEDWSDISVNAGGGDHVSAEVPSWLILQHYWYYRYTGDIVPVTAHWPYLKRLYYGQFDNKKDNIFRPDFKIPFHGDETYIYSGGEALWENRYDLQQSTYPGGGIYSADSSFELVAAGDALVEMGRAAGLDVSDISAINPRIRETTEKYYWMDDLGFYAQGMSVLYDGQLNRYPMANILANVIWSGYGKPTDPKTVSSATRMMEYLMEDSAVFNPIVGYDVAVGMLQGQCLYTLAAINHPWAEKAFYALLMIAGDTTEYSEWMAPGRDYRTMYRANRLRPWEGGINVDAALYFLTGMEPDAPNKKMTLTPRLPGGVYSPIKWDRMTVRNLPLGQGMYNLTVTDDGNGQRTYALASAAKEDVQITMNCLVPFATIDGVEVDGKKAAADISEVCSQGRATVTSVLAAGKTLVVVAHYKPTGAAPVSVAFKDFKGTAPRFDASDIVIFNAVRPGPNEKWLHGELGKAHKVVAIDATLPTDPATLQAALLSESGLKTKMLIIGPGAMSNRKATFWWDPRFDEIVGTFLKRGGVVLEANSGIASSRWLEKTLAPATFMVDYAATGFALAMDQPDEAMDQKYRWLQEMNLGEAGKWSAYWEGWYSMPYLEGGAVIKDHFFIWGEQEQPHGAMQFTMKAVPGKDHLIRVRTAPTPKKGFTLQVTEDKGGTWQDLETVWTPPPPEGKNGWLDLHLKLPARYVTDKTVTFRLKAPKGSFGGIGYEPEKFASTGAARIWIRDSLEQPPSVAAIATTSGYADKLGLPNKGLVAYSQGRIGFSGFAAPYRILGDSQTAAIIFKPIGQGLYVRSEVVVEESFPMARMIEFIEALLDPARRAAVCDAKIATGSGKR
jgi:hypothetical protein